MLAAAASFLFRGLSFYKFSGPWLWSNITPSFLDQIAFFGTQKSKKEEMDIK